MNVSVVIPTRGNVDLDPIIMSLPSEWEIVVYDNGAGVAIRDGLVVARDLPDLSVYARYAAIEYASHDVIATQDDDCIVSDPQQIVDTLTFLVRCPDCGEDGIRYDINGHLGWGCLRDKRFSPDAVVCNQPEPWRSNPFYKDHALVGFGAAFHRDAPQRAFLRALQGGLGVKGERDGFHTLDWPDVDHFRRTCDIVFTALTERVLVDIPHTSFDYASDPDRMWRQPTHQSERQRMLDLVRQVPL